MITGNIKDVFKFLPMACPRLAQALAYIAATDFSQIPNGEYEIDGRRVFARVNTYETEPREQRRSERHERYIDVQFIARGGETIWFAPFTDSCTETENRAEQDDVIFYADPHEENCVRLAAGDFAIFFPWELHRPNCATVRAGEARREQVQKIVVKVEA